MRFMFWLSLFSGLGCLGSAAFTLEVPLVSVANTLCAIICWIVAGEFEQEA